MSTSNTLPPTQSAPASTPGDDTPPFARVGTLVTTVVIELVRRLVQNIYPEGEKLPFERALVEELGVSRSVVREALRVLEEKGLVAIAQGKATSVRPMAEWNLLDPIVIDALVQHDPDLDVAGNLIEVRAAMEAALVRRTARQLDAGASAELTAAFEALEAARGDSREYIRCDREFHDALLRHSGNPIGRFIVQSAHRWTLSYPGVIPTTRVEESHEEHRAIFDAVMRGDQLAAAAAMERHITVSWEKTRAVLIAQH